MDNNEIPASIVRQPPLPPAARLIKGNIKQPEPEMVVGNSRSTRTYYPRSCKRKRLTDIGSLPDEVLLFEVLVRLPAHDIYDPARLVCSKWYRMIHTHTFIYAHLHHSTYGLLFQSTDDRDSFFMAVGESGRVEISKHRYKLIRPAQTSCNGLFLEFQNFKKYDFYFYVSNPATRQIFYLPPYVGCSNQYDHFGIAYAPASMEYKAFVLVYAGPNKRLCFILTIGVDQSWRTVGTECSSLATTQAYVNPPLITEGFVHWYHLNTNEVFTLNVETEIITETTCRIPRIVYENRRHVYLSTGRYLSLFIPSGECCWEAWELKPKIDYRWRKVRDISLEAHKCSTFPRFGFERYDFLIPIGWLKYPEILAFCVHPYSSLIFVFNLLTQEMVPVELPDPCINYMPVVHKNSLVWLGGC